MSSETPFHIHRARVAALSRHRLADDPVLIAARLQLYQERLIKQVASALESGPPVTPSMRDRIEVLINGEIAAA